MINWCPLSFENDFPWYDYYWPRNLIYRNFLNLFLYIYFINYLLHTVFCCCASQTTFFTLEKIKLSIERKKSFDIMILGIWLKKLFPNSFRGTKFYILSHFYCSFFFFMPAYLQQQFTHVTDHPSNFTCLMSSKVKQSE